MEQVVFAQPLITYIHLLSLKFEGGQMHSKAHKFEEEHYCYCWRMHLSSSKFQREKNPRFSHALFGSLSLISEYIYIYGGLLLIMNVYGAQFSKEDLLLDLTLSWRGPTLIWTLNFELVIRIHTINFLLSLSLFMIS
jgi:hypothetical protein